MVTLPVLALLVGLSVGETANQSASFASRAEKALRLIYERFNQVYNFKGLYAFKSKFHPRWEPRYLVYAAPGDLLPTLEAVALADSVGFWGEVRAELARRLAQKRGEAGGVTEPVSS